MNADKNLRICVHLRSSAVTVCFFVLAVHAQHLGVYHWAGEVDSLPRATAALDRFPFDTIRIFLGGKYDYLHRERSPARFAGVARPVTLAKIAALPRYRALFENPKIHAVWLTAYPVFDYGHGPEEIDLRRVPNDGEWKQEGRQIAELVEWLYRRYGSRDLVVLISNNETDEKLREVGSAASDNVIRDLDVRMKAVEGARARFPAAKLRVLFGVEIKLWHLGDASRALDSVVPKLRYDFISYSAWESVAHPEALGAALADISARTRDHLTPEGRAFFGEHHVLIGEFGHAREWPTEPAPLIKVFLDANVPYTIYWQLYDNASGDVRKFGLLDSRDNLTSAGSLMRTLPPRRP